MSKHRMTFEFHQRIPAESDAWRALCLSLKIDIDPDMWSFRDLVVAYEGNAIVGEPVKIVGNGHDVTWPSAELQAEADSVPPDQPLPLDLQQRIRKAIEKKRGGP